MRPLWRNLTQSRFQPAKKGKKERKSVGASWMCRCGFTGASRDEGRLGICWVASSSRRVKAVLRSQELLLKCSALAIANIQGKNSAQQRLKVSMSRHFFKWICFFINLHSMNNALEKMTSFGNLVEGHYT